MSVSFLRYDGPPAGSSALRSVSMEGTGYSSDDTASEDEGEMWNERRTSDQGEDEEEDMRKRENELKQELNMATLRCEELKRTMIETKSFIDPLHSGEFLLPSFFPPSLSSFLLSFLSFFLAFFLSFFLSFFISFFLYLFISLIISSSFLAYFLLCLSCRIILLPFIIYSTF